ncbi:MAG: DUF2975 domain-containing protein, partial [Pseudomonadota bacterium]
MTMHDKPNDLLLLAGKILTVLMQGFSALGGVVLLVLMPVLFFFHDEISADIMEESAQFAGAFPTATILGMFALIIIVLVGAFFFFGILRAIIATVGDGDPFEPANADRLNVMAWLLLGMQVLFIPIGGLGLIIA